MKTKNLNFRALYGHNFVHPIHGIHAYTAKLIPQIPRYFIEKYTQKNDIILDPFCGSGTTLLEARLLGRNAIGIDINPLATLISEVKTNQIDINELSFAIRLVKENIRNCNGKANVDFPNKDYWFAKKAQKELSKIKFCIEHLKDKFNDNINKFFFVCFSSVIRKSSYADPRMAKTYKSKRVIEKIKDGWMPTPIKYFEEALDKNFERIKALSEHLNGSNNYVKVFQGDARETSAILKHHGIKKVDFIITSPPYINAQDYFRSYKLELWWLGLATPEEVRDLNKRAIGTETILGYNYNFMPKSEIQPLNAILHKIWRMNKKKSYIVYNYFENMKIVLKECYSVLKTGGYFCLITGCNTICGLEIPSYKILAHIAKDNGFELIEVIRDEIKNRSLPPKRNHNGGIIKEEWITVFQKRR
jgi:DNA modification methylase